MTIQLRIPDRWNPHKVWLVRYTKCHHYLISQEVDGKQLYPFTRWKRYTIEEVTWTTTAELRAMIKEARA